MASDCAGYRCLDRDECYSYDHELKRVVFAHDGGSCGALQSDERLQFRYKTRGGELTTIWYANLMDITSRWMALIAF